jgi:hypothetical protein
MSERYDDAEYVPSITTTDIEMNERETPRTDALWRKLMDACKASGIPPSRANQAFSTLPEFRELEREKATGPDHICHWHDHFTAEAGKCLQAEARVTELEAKLAAALEYVETHMDEDITDNGQANDGMSLRMILKGKNR